MLVWLLGTNKIAWALVHWKQVDFGKGGGGLRVSNSVVVRDAQVFLQQGRGLVCFRKEAIRWW